MKLLRQLSFSVMALAAAATLSASSPFTLSFDFDNDADYVDSDALAPGWASSGAAFRRAKAAGFGVTSHSGDYVIGKSSVAFSEKIYTPLMALEGGKPCTISFYYYAPGATPPAVRNVGLHIAACDGQSPEAKSTPVGDVDSRAYTDWTRFEFTFTPGADGEYCFSIEPFNPNFSSSCGGAFFDDVTITGVTTGSGTGEPELVPNDDNLGACQELPYIENFSNPEHYDGTTYLPIGWNSTGTVVWVTANLNALPADDGEYYMIAYHSDYERDENAYTPFFNLEAGRTYTATFKTFVQGNDYNAEADLTLPELRFTVGTEQDAEFHTTLLTVNDRSSGWVARTASFTPAVGGPYCFAFMLSGPANSGIVAVDNLTITSEGLVAAVEPAFGVIGSFDLMDSGLTVDTSTPVQFVNCSKYADRYEWHAEGAQPEVSDEANPAFLFPTPGEYTVEMTAFNAKGSRTTSHTYMVKTAESGQGYVLSPFNGGADRLLDRGYVPAYTTSPDDYVTGFNHYYYAMAQRFDLPAATTFDLSQVSCWVSDRRYAAIVEVEINNQNSTPLDVVVYGSDENGMIDPENVIGRQTVVLGEALGGYGLGSIAAESRFVNFENPVPVSGTVYVAFEFSPELKVDPIDDLLGRSYISTTAIRHGHGITTLFARPYNVPEGSEAKVGEWCPVDRLDESMAGLGAYWHLWVRTAEGASVALTPDGQVAFEVAVGADGIVTVSGTKAGSTVTLYDAAGRVALSVPSADDSTTLDASGAGHGVFIVAFGSDAARIAL